MSVEDVPKICAMSESNLQSAEVRAPSDDDTTDGNRYRATLDVDHPNIVDVRRELTLQDGTWKYVMVVVTDLPLDPNHPDHNTKDIDGVTQAVMKAVRKTRAGYNILTIRNP